MSRKWGQPPIFQIAEELAVLSTTSDPRSMDGDDFVIAGFVPAIHFSSCPGVRGWMGPSDKHWDDKGIKCRLKITSSHIQLKLQSKLVAVPILEAAE